MLHDGCGEPTPSFEPRQFVHNPINVPALAEMQAANFPCGSFGFSRERTAVRKLFERIQAIDEFLEPLGAPERRPFNGPVVNLIGVVLR